MRVGEIGDPALVAALRRRLGVPEPADDCARLDVEGTLVASTDVVRATDHFPEPMTPRQQGRYAAAVNLSDLASCGAEPVGLLAAWGLPDDLDVETVETIAGGFAGLAEDHGCPVLGGDTKPASELTIAGVALGTVDGDGMPRAGAEPGQAVCVTGRLGAAARDLARWRDGATDDLDALISPTPRLAEGRALADAGATAAVDLSDGLADALHRIAEASGVGARLDGDAIPVADGATDEQAIFGAGDFELVAAIDPDRVPEATRAVREAGGELARIGEVVGEGVTVDGEPVEDRGWAHFGDRQNQDRPEA